MMLQALVDGYLWHIGPKTTGMVPLFSNVKFQVEPPNP